MPFWVLSGLHSRVFAYPLTTAEPWAQRLQRHGLTWVGAFHRASLIGFVHACWNGDAHAFALDTVVDPDYQRRGVGRAVVRHSPRK